MELHPEIKTKELGNPLSLRDRREALVKHVFQCIMIRAHHKGATPEVGAPMAHSVDEPDQFAFVRRHLEMPDCKRPAVECKWPGTLMEYCAEAGAGRVTVHHEGLAEIW